MLAGAFDQEISYIIFGGRLIALSKKDGGVRPICVGYTLRRLAAKCANSHVISRRSQVLQPQQLGVGSQVGLRQQCMQQEDLSAIYQLVTWSSS